MLESTNTAYKKKQKVISFAVSFIVNHIIFISLRFFGWFQYILANTVRLCKMGSYTKNLTRSLFLMSQILHLASLLQISGSDENSRRGRVLMLIAESAIQALDYCFACETCQGLISEEYAPVWTICR